MNIEISTERLDMDIRTMQDQVDALYNAQTQVFRCLENLNAMWDGTANQVFIAQTNLDRGKLEVLLQNLRNLIECMEYAKSEYQRCQSDVDDKISGLRLSSDT